MSVCERCGQEWRNTHDCPIQKEDIIAALRDELERVREQHLVIMTGHDCTWGIGSGRHCPDDKPCRTHKLAAAVAERDAAIANERKRCLDWIRLKWRFDHQTHTHTWHDFADCIARIQDGGSPPKPIEKPPTLTRKQRAAALVARHDTVRGEEGKDAHA